LQAQTEHLGSTVAEGIDLTTVDAEESDSNSSDVVEIV
jgi:hypothetical protein